MFRDSAPAEPAPPCSVCRAPSIGTFWEGHICGECHSAWCVADTDMEAAEAAYAAAHPEAVEARGVLSSGRAWLSLTKDAHVEMCRGVARVWAVARRQVLGGAASQRAAREGAAA